MSSEPAVGAGATGGGSAAPLGVAFGSGSRIFPLPQVVRPEVVGLSSGGHAVQRRRRACRQRDEVNDALFSLNWLAGFREPPGDTADIGSAPTVLQEEVQARVRRRAAALIPDDVIPPPQTAFHELLRGRDMYNMSTANPNLATFTSVAGISIPSDLSGSPFLDDVLPARLQPWVDGPLQRLVRDPSEFDPEFEASLPAPYWDMALKRSHRKFIRLMRALLRIGLVRALPRGAALESAGLFFVHKAKKKSLRLIIDARRANARFRTPPGVALCTSEGLSRIEVDSPNNFEDDPEGLAVFLGVADVQDAFHRFRLRDNMAVYFGLGSARLADLRCDSLLLSDVATDVGGCVDLVWASLPMGFSWSLYFCQTINEAKMGTIPELHDSTLMTDRGRAAVLRRHSGTSAPCAHFVYVDNLGIISTSSHRVATALSQTTNLFDEAGLLTHEHSVTSEKSEALGVCLDGRRLETRVSTKRYWKVRRALDFALSLRRLPGHVWRIILGHLTFVGLVCRDSLSCFSAIYGFIERHDTDTVPLWPTARQELERFRGLMPLLASEWSAEWSPLVMSTDASEEACGVTGSFWPPAVVAYHGRLSERRRFARVASTQARSHFDLQCCLEAFDATSLRTDEDKMLQESEPWVVDPEFVEIPVGLLRGDSWSELVRRRWVKTDNILLLEARALLRGLEVHLALAPKGPRRILMLTDNMSVCLSFSRRRAINFKLLCAIRKFSGTCMALGLSVSVRWIPSEWNTADPPSRMTVLKGAVSRSHFFADLRQLIPSSLSLSPCHGANKVPFSQCLIATTGGAGRHEIANPCAEGTAADHWRTAADCSALNEAPADPTCSSRAQNSKTFSPCGGDTETRGSACTRAGGGERRHDFDQQRRRPEAAAHFGIQEQAPMETAWGLRCRRKCRFGHLPGESGSDSSHPQAIQRESGAVVRLPGRNRRGARGRRGHRQIVVCLHDEVVGRRAPVEPGRVPDGRAFASHARVQPFWPAPSPSCLASSPRMAPIYPSAIPSSTFLAYLVWNCLGALPFGCLDHGCVPPAHGHVLFPPFGAVGHPPGRLGGTSIGSTADLVDPALPGCPLSPLESPRQKRDCRHRLAPCTVVGEADADPGRRQCERARVPLQLCRLLEAVAPRDPSHASAASALSGAPFRSQSGRGTPVPVPKADPRQRPLGHPKFSPKVREARPPCRLAHLPRARMENLLRGGRCTSRGFVLGDGGRRGRHAAADPRLSRSERGDFLADIFGGTGGVSRAARRRDIQGRIWDTRWGHEFDLLKRSVRRAIAREAKAGHLIAAMLAPPCTSFSIAQRGALRSLIFPWGKPRLPPDKQAKVLLGNRLARVALQLAHLFQKLGIPWIIEHPATSYFWKCAETQTLMSQPKVETIIFEQCAFGSRHRKSTTLMCGHLDRHDLDNFANCRCPVAGPCSFSGRSHIVLVGSQTSKSQHYPPALAQRLADLLLHRQLHSRTL